MPAETSAGCREGPPHACRNFGRVPEAPRAPVRRKLGAIPSVPRLRPRRGAVIGVIGIGGEGLGGGASGTGAGALVGVPVMVASASLVTGAAANIAAGWADVTGALMSKGEPESGAEQAAAPKLPRFNGPKPKYAVNPAHVRGPGLRPGKTPLPADAEDVYKGAVPNDPTDPRAWFGRNAERQIYRHSLGNDGIAHFSGIDGVGDGTRNLTEYAIDRLNGL